MDRRYTLSLSLVLLLCLLVFSLALGKKSIATDHSSLLTLKSHIIWDSNHSHFLSNWTHETSVCNWIGVSCSSRHHRVVALNISNLGLHGTIPQHIGNLSFLKSIDLSSNHLKGQLPGEIAKLRRLEYMDFSDNSIVGEVPGWLGSLPDLHYLDFGSNNFSGHLPSSLFNATKLLTLSLRSNQLNGYIPDEVGDLGNLRVLNMDYNQFEGFLPLSILNLSSLQVIGFTTNRLYGHLLRHFCSKLPHLTGIHLSDNHFSGEIQSRLDNCSKLEVLSLSFNNFTGLIPREIGNLTRLVGMYLGYNQYQGQIPSEIGNLQRLSDLSLENNFLGGSIPESIFNISSLSLISLSFNNLRGNLPLSIGQNLPNLIQLYASANSLSGVIPMSVANLTKLTLWEVTQNQFTGPIPTCLGNLRFLQTFAVPNNFLTTDSSNEFSFLTSLTNCRSLESIKVGHNPLNIPHILPSIGNFSSSLVEIFAQSCGIGGNIPYEIGNLSSLIYLNLQDNRLIGPLPPTIQKLSNLQGVAFEGNKITGLITELFCNMRQLSLLYLGKNQFYGPVPKCFGNITFLTYLHLDSNRFNSTLPTLLGNLRTLLDLDVHSNFLSGNITPAIGMLKAALSIDLSENNFSGNIPLSIGGLGNLINLSLAHNQLQGPIPETFRNLLSLEKLELSHNNLTGEIPATLGTLTELKHFNVSFNQLRGRIPENGSFLNFGNESYIANDGLCGGAFDLHFPPCVNHSPQGSSWKKLRIIAYVLIPTAALVIVITCILFVFIRKCKQAGTHSQEELVPPSMLERISFYEIQQATDGFNRSNLLGTGSFGSVYRGVLRDGTILAVKVFHLQLEGAFKSFETECEILSNIRHRNLLKVINSCSNLDFKALVLEYMPNGSLDRWLYSDNDFLNFSQRLSIMIDVASALDYLHSGYTSVIVHCDIKPSNVLLDEQMVGHVSDFGISKLLAGGQDITQTMMLATIGYTAPEYGSQGLVSISCDIYSFGILLMETFSRKKPTDDMFGEGWGLKDMITDCLLNSATDFIDQNLLTSGDKNSEVKVKCILCIMELALRCVVDSPEKRPAAREVLTELQKSKQKLLVSNSEGIGK